MKIAVLSPEHDDPREIAVLDGMLSLGLERYHVRKPGISAEQLSAWLKKLPAAWRPHLVLHQNHELVAEFGLGGRHWRDDGNVPLRPTPRIGFTSRSCHDLAGLRLALRRYDAVFFGPVFPSLSKPGHLPRGEIAASKLTALLGGRSPAERRTSVMALGGVTTERLAQILALGFDGVGVLGAVWQAPDPIVAFFELQAALAALPVEAAAS